MKILVLNSGSSSLKFQLIETSAERIAANDDLVLAKGTIEKIGTGDAMVIYEPLGKPKTRHSQIVLTHQEAIRAAFECLTGRDGVLANLNEIEGVGHRIVHGGEGFQHSMLMDDHIVRQIEACVDLAPLHNPHNLKGYFATRDLLPKAKHVAVFDTAFHQTMPPHAFLYGIPYLYYTRDRVRRYGFHGTSHRYVSYRFGQIHGKKRDEFKLISCHLGNGCSICAIDRGRSVDTSMGFTPLEGLIMGTRCGDLDPGAVMYLVGRAEMGLHEVEVILNKQSGLYGLSGISNDMRDLLHEMDASNTKARMAVDAFCYRVKKYIGAFYAVMDGADAILFTGGIGENAAPIRARILDGLTSLGIDVDSVRNNASAPAERKISSDAARVPCWVIPTNEELLIARDTLRCIAGLHLR